MEIDIFKVVTTLLGGLAVFIFGMNLMSEGLQKAAGDKMKSVLSMLTANPILGVLAGALTTAVLQSSSATTVMVIGFVTANLMKLPQAISVILGANIGTTITAQLIAFDIGDYAWIGVFIGFVMMFFMKSNEKVADIGEVLFGFGLLFVGINTMGDTMEPLAQSPIFAEWMMKVADIPILGVVLGTVMTMIIQSSSAVIAVLQNLAATAGPDGVTSIIGLTGALPILFGSNIGTTITALFASIGGSVNAKRTAIAHTIFNFGGTLIFIWFIPQISSFIQYISPAGPEVDVIAREIANAHMLFNVACTLLFLPFIWLLVKIVTKIIPGEDKEILTSEPAFIDYNVIGQPVFAIHLAIKELVRTGKLVTDMVVKAKKAFISGDLSEVNEIIEADNVINHLRDEILKYLSMILSSESITDFQKQTVAALFHVAGDIEHIGDYSKNIVALAEEKNKNKYALSDTAYAEIYECFDKIKVMMADTFTALESGDHDLANNILAQEDDINVLEAKLRKQHMERLERGQCSPAVTVVYIDTVHNIERIGDSCNNIAETVIARHKVRKRMKANEENTNN